MATPSLFRVDGMVAVVTGGGTGIGFHMAKALANAGAKSVYILSQRKEVLEEAAKAHESLRPLVCDVGSKTSLQAAVDAISQEVGHVNLVIANAGVIGPAARFQEDESVAELKRRLFDDVSMDEFTHTMHVNVTGAYFTMLAFLELLDAGNKRALEGGFGAPLPGGATDVPSIQSQVLFTSSISAYSRSRLSLPAYSGSKSATAHLAKQASSNLAPHGIRVNAIAPGLFPSVLASGLIEGRDPSKEHPSELRFIPARRFGGEDEMAGTVLYLASRAGSYCNGLILVTDGGKLSTMPSEY
ncbi:short chain dehydrogenase [Nemania sp. NC0429]|nr:short chain dehydrogenase [Nemania sp. NC0429]